MSTMITVLKVVCSLISICLYLSPMIRMRHVIRDQTTGETPLLPLVCMFCNYHCWMLYGFFVGDVFPLSATTFLGNVLGQIYTFIYIKYTPDRVYALKVCAAAFVIMGAITLYAVLAWIGVIQQSNASVGQVLGYCSVVATFVFYSSPLATIRKVLTTKSSASMLFPMVVMATSNNLLWSIYALVASDMFLLVPNSCCFCFGLLQIYLYFKFHPDKLGQTHILQDLENLAISIVISPKHQTEQLAGVQSPTYEIMNSPKLAPIAEVV